MNNRKCDYCGKEFHACSSCGLLYEYEYKYCSDSCYFNSHEYLSLKNRVNKFTAFLDLEKLFLFLNEFEEDNHGELLIAINSVKADRDKITNEYSKPCPDCIERGDTVCCKNKNCMDGIIYF